MACSKYASTQQTTNAARMSRLLFGPCTDILRDVLRQHIPETSFPVTLQNRRVKGILLRLRNLQASQRELLYPQVGTFSGSYEDFDISLLYLLLRNITNITPHRNGWGSPPDQTDRSVSANIDRIRRIRNQIGAHCHRHDLSDADFSSCWAELKLSIVEIGRSTGISTNYEQLINDLANEPMDPDREDYWIELLQKQIQDDVEKYEKITKKVDNIREKIEGISSEQAQQAQIQTRHGTTLTDHEDRLNKQSEVQTTHRATLTDHEDRLTKQSEVQTTHGATLTDYEGRLTKQSKVQTTHAATLTDHEDRLTKQSKVQTIHSATLTDHEDRLTRQSKLQTTHATTLTDHEGRLTQQREVQTTQRATLTDHEGRLIQQSRVLTTHGFTLTQYEDRLTEQGCTLKEYEKRLNKQEAAQNQEAKNILDSTKAILQNQKSCKTYIRTKQIDNVIRKLHEQHIVILTGKPDDGKTTIAKQVLCELSKDGEYFPVIITKPEQWDKVVNPYEKMVVYIDDIFGSTNVDNSAVEEWTKMFESRISSATEGKIFVLISSRSTIIAEVRKSCEKRFLNPEYENDLASNVLTSKEKENMLFQYEKVHIYRTSELNGDEFRKYETLHGKDAVYKISRWEKIIIAKSEPYYGFPQTCFLFFARKEFFQLGLNFFLRANKTLFENIDNFRKSTDVRTKMQYCTLAYVFLEGSIYLRKIKKDIFQEICEKSNLAKWTEVDVEDAVQDLEGIYLSPSNQKYVFTFCHVTIREAVAASFGKLAPDIVIQKCSMKMFEELIRTEGYEERDGEVILTIKKKYYPLLANRMLSEGVVYMLYHPATDDTEFTPVLFDVINQSSHNNRTIIREIWNKLIGRNKPVLYKEILTRHGPHHIKHIKHKAEYNSDVSVDEPDSDTSVERPYLITCEQVKYHLKHHLMLGNKQRVISIIGYVISNCDVNYFLNSYKYFSEIRGMTVLHFCVARGWTDLGDEILNVVTPTKTENNWSCLHFASFFGRFKLFKKFEKVSSNVLETTLDGYNILRVALLGLRYGMYKPSDYRRSTVYNLSVSYSNSFIFVNIPEQESDFINIVQHVMTAYPSLITTIDMSLDEYNNNNMHYLVIHDRQEIYDILIQKKKDLIFHRNDSELPTTLHVAAYLGRVKFVEKLWKAGVRAEVRDLSIAKCIESGQQRSGRTVRNEFRLKNQWLDLTGTDLNNIKLKCISWQSVRFGCTEDFIAISSICTAIN